MTDKNTYDEKTKQETKQAISSSNMIYFIKNKLFMSIFASVILSSAAASFITNDTLKDAYKHKNSQKVVSINYNESIFMKDGLAFQYISGSLHYFRIPQIYWNDRILKAKAAGLDCIQTVVPWNFHELEENLYNFDGIADLEQFIYTVHQHGLLLIVRIGPFIGSDWSNGGLPPWLLRKNPYMRMRTSDPEFKKAVTNWFGILLPKLKKHLYVVGGPIIMVQMENDYGESGLCDPAYLQTLNKLIKTHLGDQIIISTNDIANRQHLTCGSPFEENLATIHFGPFEGDPDDQFFHLYEFQPNKPWVTSEYHTGWMDHWGLSHYYVSTAHFVDGLISLLSYSPRVSVNIYLFHGGTNFGLWSGAIDNPFATQVTSYDYNAPLTESGDTTEFYDHLREAIAKFKNITLPEYPRNTNKKVYESIQLKLVSHLLSHVSLARTSRVPLSMEFMNQLRVTEDESLMKNKIEFQVKQESSPQLSSLVIFKYEGFLAYVVEFYRKSEEVVKLKFRDLADYAYIFTTRSTLDKLTYHGSVSRNDQTMVFYFKTSHDITQLVIVVENAGYSTYGSRKMNDMKGILGPVSADGKELRNWSMMRICLESNKQKLCNSTLTQSILSNLFENKNVMRRKFDKWPVQGSIYFGELWINGTLKPEDTFVQPLNFTRVCDEGILILNDQILGRFNQALGPQLSLFVPKSYLKAGLNTFVLIELDSLWLNNSINDDYVNVGMSLPMRFVNQTLWKSTRKRPLN